MKVLFEEINRRFPEVRSRELEDNADSPYTVMGLVADWLKQLSRSEVTPEIVHRLQSFRDWCEQQPRGEDAGNDIYTILVVGFYENLFDEESTRSLIPKLISKEDLIQNAEYLKSWVGSDNYQLALEQY